MQKVVFSKDQMPSAILSCLTNLPTVRLLLVQGPIPCLQVDLLPKGTDESAVRDWLTEMAAAKRVNVIHTCLVSSKSRAGVADATAFIRRNRLGRDVYIVGAANVGKSAFSRYVSIGETLQC